MILDTKAVWDILPSELAIDIAAADLTVISTQQRQGRWEKLAGDDGG